MHDSGRNLRLLNLALIPPITNRVRIVITTNFRNKQIEFPLKTGLNPSKKPYK